MGGNPAFLGYKIAIKTSIGAISTIRVTGEAGIEASSQIVLWNP